MKSNKLLIVDDEPGFRSAVRDYLEAKGYRVSEAGCCKTAEEQFRASVPDIAIIDYLLPDGTALELMPKLRSVNSGAAVLILTGHGSIELAVRAVKEGAEHFLTKPVEFPALLVILERILENQRNRQKQLASKTREGREMVDPFIGTSAAIRHLADQAKRVLSSDSPVLIQGETGTGKGVLANWLHTNGSRSEETFVDLNCAGLVREFLETELFGHEKGAFTGAVSTKTGLLEVAHKGTVFLDEIGDIDLQVQPKLLKVLEEKRFRRLGDVRDRSVDIRLVAATHQDLGRLVRENKFRADLYFRINTLPLSMPALRERLEDIPPLAQHLLRRIGSDLGRNELALSGEAIQKLTEYSWPGNIRELRNVLERAVLLTDRSALKPNDFRFDVPSGAGGSGVIANLTLTELEHLHIETVLREESGNVMRTAQRLQIPRSSLYQKIKNYRICLS